jgi:hypothetical protein
MCQESNFQYIESVTFASVVNVNSGFKAMLRVLEREPEIIQFAKEAKQSLQCAETIYQRMVVLLAQVSVDEYSGFLDAALTGYLFILKNVNMTLAAQISRKIEIRENLWWARKLAQMIVEQHMTTGLAEYGNLKPIHTAVSICVATQFAIGKHSTVSDISYHSSSHYEKIAAKAS